MKRYKFFTNDTDKDTKQRTIVEERMLYEEDGSEVVVNSQKTTIAQLEQEHQDKIDNINAEGRNIDALVDKVNEIGTELSESVPDLAKVVNADRTKPETAK